MCVYKLHFFIIVNKNESNGFFVRITKISKELKYILYSYLSSQ